MDQVLGLGVLPAASADQRHPPQPGCAGGRAARVDAVEVVQVDRVGEPDLLQVAQALGIVARLLGQQQGRQQLREQQRDDGNHH